MRTNYQEVDHGEYDALPGDGMDLDAIVVT